MAVIYYMSFSSSKQQQKSPQIQLVNTNSRSLYWKHYNKRDNVWENNKTLSEKINRKSRLCHIFDEQYITWIYRGSESPQELKCMKEV